jgi:5-methylcytosine-specific restriction endonuclease McrA
MQKLCIACNQEKPTQSFGKTTHKNGNVYFKRECNQCRNKKNLLLLWKKGIKKRQTIKDESDTGKEAKRKKKNAQNKMWREKNPEKWKISNRANKHRRRAAGAVDINLWNLKLRLLDYSCACCGIKENITIDHILPISKGGSNSIDNLQPLCLTCNKTKFTKHINYLEDRNVIKL